MAEKSTGGPTAQLYKGRLYPLDVDKKNLEKEHEKRVKAEQEGGEANDGNAWREFNIPGVSGSGEPQPEKGGVVNDEKTAAKGLKQAEKDEKDADRGAAKK